MSRPTYVIIQYAPDLATGECLNVGLVLLDQTRDFCGLEIDQHGSRLRDAFAHFDFRDYKLASAALRHQIERAYDRRRSQLPYLATGSSELGIAGILAECIQDESLSFKVLPERRIAPYADPSTILRHLYDRYVLAGQRARRNVSRRKDQDVWRDVYAKPLRQYNIVHRLTERSVELPRLPPLKFDHAFKNGVWRVFQPISFDLAEGESIRDKAYRWVGNSSVLKSSSDIGHIYFMTGRPQTPNLIDAYHGALQALKLSDIENTVLTEEEAESFALDIAPLFHELSH